MSEANLLLWVDDCFDTMNRLIFNVKQCFIPNSYLATVTSPKFWYGVDEEFPLLSKHAFEVIIPFQNTYMCEAGFSSMMTIKQNINLD